MYFGAATCPPDDLGSAAVHMLVKKIVEEREDGKVEVKCWTEWECCYGAWESV